MDYRFTFRITNEDGETVAAGSTYLDPERINEFGECESVDLEVSSVLRSYRKVWLKEQEPIEEEIPEELDYTGAGDPLDNDR